MATIKQYELKNGNKRWMFQIYLGLDPLTGKQKNAMQRGFPTKREAKAAMDRVQAQYNSGEKPTAETTGETFEDVYEMWKVNYELTVKESTFVKTTEQFRLHVIPTFGKILISQITVLQIQKFINSKVNVYKKYKDLIMDLSRIFEYAINLDLITNNPTKRITMPKPKPEIDEEKRQNYYTKEELNHFLQTCREQQPFRFFTFFQLLAASGCREGEVLGLEWRNIDFENRCIHIVQGVARGKDRRLYLEVPKTKHSKRVVSLDPTTMAILSEWRTRQKVDLLKLGFNVTANERQLVFANENNSLVQLSKPRTWMLQNMKKNNLREITIHGFRHTHATLLLEAGVEPKVISERLGHASIKITLDLYSHVTKRMETAVPGVFESVMEEASLKQNLKQSKKIEPANV